MNFKGNRRTYGQPKYPLCDKRTPIFKEIELKTSTFMLSDCVSRIVIISDRRKALTASQVGYIITACQAARPNVTIRRR